MATIGIMQGRLGPPVEGRFQSFPRGRWADELPRAASAGLNGVEWIYDTFGEGDNPLETDAGIAQLNSLAAECSLAIKSLCADYYLDRPFLRATPADRAQLAQRLHWLLGRCPLIGVKHVVVPFVDASRIETPAEEDEVLELMRSALGYGVELHLETSLPPARFAALLARLPHPFLKANYDSGNSSSLGYAPAEEFAAYGDRVGSVHIKDRIKGGGTVPLGTGDADFPSLFKALRRFGYAGDYILQVARGEPGDEVACAAKNREWLEGQLLNYGLSRTGGEA